MVSSRSEQKSTPSQSILRCSAMCVLTYFVTQDRLWLKISFGCYFFSLDSHDVDNGSPMNEVVSYPNNLTVHDLYFFMAVPTLCYELNFPRTSRIRKRFLIKRVIEVLVGMQVVLGLFQQWIIPSVKNSLETFSVCCYFFKFIVRFHKSNLKKFLFRKWKLYLPPKDYWN